MLPFLGPHPRLMSGHGSRQGWPLGTAGLRRVEGVFPGIEPGGRCSPGEHRAKGQAHPGWGPSVRGTRAGALVGNRVTARAGILTGCSVASGRLAAANAHTPDMTHPQVQALQQGQPVAIKGTGVYRPLEKTPLCKPKVVGVFFTWRPLSYCAGCCSLVPDSPPDILSGQYLAGAGATDVMCLHPGAARQGSRQFFFSFLKPCPVHKCTTVIVPYCECEEDSIRRMEVRRALRK